MSDYVPTKHERESAEAREALWNALGRRPDELFAIASALTAAEERGRRRGVEAHIRDLDAIEDLLNEFGARDSHECVRVVQERVVQALAALAPRDSAPAKRVAQHGNWDDADLAEDGK